MTTSVFGLTLENRAYMSTITGIALLFVALFVWWVAVKYEKKPERESAPVQAE